MLSSVTLFANNVAMDLLPKTFLPPHVSFKKKNLVEYR